MPKNLNTDILIKLEGYFREAVRAPSWKDFQTNAVKVSDYKENKHWTAEDLKELKARNQQPYINNQVKVTIDYLNGQFVQIKTRIGARPRNGETDQQAADAMSHIFRYVSQNNALEFEERDCADSGFTVGRGVLDVQMVFDNIFQPEIKIRWEDALAVHPDPHSKHYDWNDDALYVCRSKWIDVDKAAELYPTHSARLRGMLSGEDPAHGDLSEKDASEGNKESLFIDSDRRRIRLVEVEYKKFKREVLWIADDRTISESDISEAAAKKAGHQKIVRVNHTISLGVFTEGLLLEHAETENERFSLLQFLVHRKRSGEPYGPCLPALPLQDSINKRGSKAMHLLNSRRVKYERGAVTDPEKLAEELAKPDGQIELNEGKFEKFEWEDNRELAATHMAFHDSDLANFRRVTGVNPDALGEKSEIRSGIGVARKVAQTKTVSAGAFDNFRRTREVLYLTVVDRVQHYYTPRKIELITDDPQDTKVIELTPDGSEDGSYSLAAVKQGKYDIVIAEMPDLINTEAEQFQTLAELLPTMSQTSPFWARMLLKASSLPDKDKYIAQLDALPKGPQIQPKMTISAQLDNMSPVERAYLYQQMGAAEVAQAVMQENRPPSSMIKLQAEQMKLQGAMAKTQAQIEQIRLKAQVEGQKAEYEIQVAEAEARAATIQSKIDIVLAQMELEKQRLEIEKAELAVEKAEVDIEKTRAQAKAAKEKPKPTGGKK